MNPLDRWKNHLRRHEPNWVMIILIINLAWFALSLFISQPEHQSSAFGPSSEALYLLGSNQPHAIREGQWHRLVVANFLHGSVLHILFNCYFIWSFGFIIQAILGASRFIILYLFSALTGAVASLAWRVLSNPGLEWWQLPGSIGASTAVFGLLGFLFLWSRRTPGTPIQSGPIMWCILINLALGFQMPQIDNAGHIGGLLGGFLVAGGVVSRRSIQPVRFFLSRAMAFFLVILTLVSFAASAWFYMGPFGRTCRVLYSLRPLVMTALEADTLDSNSLKESADEVAEAAEEVGDDFPVFLKGLEDKLRWDSTRTRGKVALNDALERLAVLDGWRRFCREYIYYLGHTSRLTYSRSR